MLVFFLLGLDLKVDVVVSSLQRLYVLLHREYKHLFLMDIDRSHISLHEADHARQGVRQLNGMGHPVDFQNKTP